MKTLFSAILVLIGLLPVCAFSAVKTDASTADGATTYVLKGTVMDTSDNVLNKVSLVLSPFGAEAQTDANGEFTLEFSVKESFTLGNRKVAGLLRVEREGHIPTKLRFKTVNDLATETPIEIKLEPEPIDPSMIGFTIEMEAPKGRKGTATEFHVYIPESVEKVRAAFYISRHGMGNITLPVLRKFAEEEKVALVGMYGDPVQRGVGSVAVLDDAVKKLAEMSGHSELTEVPIMTFGHSNGTGFAASWPRDRPDRVIAWVAFRPGFSNYLQYPNTEKVPAMVMCGTVDKYFLRSRQDQVAAEMRKTRNAAMCMMMEHGVGHGPADANDTWEFITDYLKAAMRIRLNEDGTLKPVDIEAGWLGAVYDVDEGGRQLLNIAPYAEFKGDRSTANWLPDGAFAKTWQRFGKEVPPNKKN